MEDGRMETMSFKLGLSPTTGTSNGPSRMLGRENSFFSCYSPTQGSVHVLKISSVSWLKESPIKTAHYLEGYKDQRGDGRAIVVGPWGGNGGTNWDDGSYNGIREITLMFGRCIDSIRIVYDRNGKPVTGEKHGGVGGGRTAEIKLDFPDEFLTTVWGHYSPVVLGGSSVIRSLTFKSNKRTCGPFGVEEGTPFCFPMEGGQIVGFKGKCGWYLDSIGFHITRTKNPKVMQKVQQRFRRLTSSVSFAGFRDTDENRAKSSTKLPA